MVNKYPILRPNDVITALSKKGFVYKVRKEAMQNISMEIV
jgi:hypothetical protein